MFHLIVLFMYAYSCLFVMQIFVDWFSLNSNCNCTDVWLFLSRMWCRQTGHVRKLHDTKLCWIMTLIKMFRWHTGSHIMFGIWSLSTQASNCYDWQAGLNIVIAPNKMYVVLPNKLFISILQKTTVQLLKFTYHYHVYSLENIQAFLKNRTKNLLRHRNSESINFRRSV